MRYHSGAPAHTREQRRDVVVYVALVTAGLAIAGQAVVVVMTISGAISGGLPTYVGAPAGAYVIGALVYAVRRASRKQESAGRADDARRPAAREALISALAGVAGVLAGRRHAHLREAWAADLHGDPETGKVPSASRRLQLAAGDVVAALRCRLDDATALAWRPVDALLASWRGSRLAMFTPVAVAVALVLSHEAFYGLVANAENLGVIATAPYAAIKGLRKYRQISTPKRPERKASSAGSSER
jgi:hypothetical protein